MTRAPDPRRAALRELLEAVERALRCEATAADDRRVTALCASVPAVLGAVSPGVVRARMGGDIR